MLGFLMDVEAGPVWSTWGGDATLRSYGVAPPLPTAPLAEWEEARRRSKSRCPT